jgi:hypothetical protein
MVHERQGLSFRLEASHDLFGVHAQLDHFQRYPPTHWLFLFRHVDDPTATLADLLEELVVANPIPEFLGDSSKRQGAGALIKSFENAGPERPRFGA